MINIHHSNLPLFRPPAEARSLIIRIAEGCPWNRCTFCGMYKEVPYRSRSMVEIKGAVAEAQQQDSSGRRIFLADGDVMALPYDRLKTVMELLNDFFPRLARVNVYANGRSILQKDVTELGKLRELGLNTLYMGLESGSEETLQAVKKRETAEEMVEAARRAQAAGLKMSVMVLTGLGGKTDSESHLCATAEALNRMQPRLLSALRVIPIPGTALFNEVQAGRFIQLTEFDAVAELRNLIRKLELEQTVFRANHSSNILPLEGRFPKDKRRILDELDTLLDSGALDTTTPGAPPLSM